MNSISKKLGLVLFSIFFCISGLWWLGVIIAEGSWQNGGYPYDCTTFMCDFVNHARQGVFGSTIITLLAIPLPLVVYLVPTVVTTMMLAKSNFLTYIEGTRPNWASVVILVAGILFPLTLIFYVLYLLMVGLTEVSSAIVLYFRKLIK